MSREERTVSVVGGSCDSSFTPGAAQSWSLHCFIAENCKAGTEFHFLFENNVPLALGASPAEKNHTGHFPAQMNPSSFIYLHVSQ